MKYYRVLTPLLVAMALFGAGLGLGTVAGPMLVKGMLLNGSRSSMVFFKPATEFIHTYRLINSGNALDRLSGYYSLLDNNMVIEYFLFDRFKAEKTDLNRKTILWVLGHSGSRKKLIEFYSGIYSESSRHLRSIILRNTMKMGEQYFADFIKQNNVREPEIRELLDE